ncbi:MAG: hypothetical protein ABI854_02480 [Betaproteobacteria bacterium]
MNDARCRDNVAAMWSGLKRCWTRISVRVDRLPRPLRRAFDGIQSPSGGIGMASYLLFNLGFCGELIDLGQPDARTRIDWIKAFLGLGVRYTVPA